MRDTPVLRPRTDCPVRDAVERACYGARSAIVAVRARDAHRALPERRHTVQPQDRHITRSLTACGGQLSTHSGQPKIPVTRGAQPLRSRAGMAGLRRPSGPGGHRTAGDLSEALSAAPDRISPGGPLTWAGEMIA